MLPYPRRLAGPLALAGALSALFSASAAHAQVSITPIITQTGSLYNYSYSITNFTNTDLAIINISGLPLESDTAANLMAPAGFQTTFDPGVGILSFLPGSEPNQQFSAGSTLAGFSFDSVFAPATVSYDTLDVSGGTTTGTTMGPAGAPVPEASTLISLGMGLSVLAFAVARRRRVTSVGTQS